MTALTRVSSLEVSTAAASNTCSLRLQTEIRPKETAVIAVDSYLLSFDEAVRTRVQEATPRSETLVEWAENAKPPQEWFDDESDPFVKG